MNNVSEGSSERVEEAIARLAVAQAATVAVAESCTGGLVAYRLTSVPGSSRWFWGGIVAYTPEVKVRVVRVSRHLLKEKGVVSAETALALAEGARGLLQAEIGVGVTGYAGPEGGTAEAPVGTIYLGLAAADVKQTIRGYWQGDRASVRTAATEAALNLLRAYLERRLP